MLLAMIGRAAKSVYFCTAFLQPQKLDLSVDVKTQCMTCSRRLDLWNQVKLRKANVFYLYRLLVTVFLSQLSQIKEGNAVFAFTLILKKHSNEKTRPLQFAFTIHLMSRI